MNVNLPAGNSAKRVAAHAAGAALAVGLAFVFYQGIYAPLHVEAAERAVRIEKVRALTAASSRVADEHRAMVDRYDCLMEVAEQTRRRMPSEASAGEFVEQATRLAAELGIVVEQIQTALPQTSDNRATIEVSCRLVGSYASTCRFLAAIDQLSQISNVARFELARTTNSAGYPVQVTFQLYYQLDPHDKDQQRGTL